MKCFEIIQGKCYTSYGIANAATIIVETIFNDSKTILPVSSYSSEAGCYIGHPAVVGRQGIIRDFHLELDEKEQEKWNHSVETIKNTRPN